MAHSTHLFAIEEDPFFVEDLMQMSRAENYRRWQFDMVAPFIKGKVLEVGGGIGNFTPEFARVADSVISVEPNSFCFGRLKEQTKSLPNVHVRNSTAEELDRDLRKEGVDTVVMMNVLEHIKDDQAVLASFKQWLRPAGRIVLLVPAGPWAFGSTDERLGHYRRYSKKYARDLIRRLRLNIQKLRYYNFIGIWGWWWNAKIARQSRSTRTGFVPQRRSGARQLHHLLPDRRGSASGERYGTAVEGDWVRGDRGNDFSATSSAGVPCRAPL